MGSIRRPGGTLDTRMLGQAVSFPGIDPRSWVSLGVVTAVNVANDGGPMVDLVTLPNNQTATARVGAPYGAGGFGDWCPIAVDDEVIVIAPDGEPAHGLVVVARLWCQADPVPDLAVANPLDRLIQAKPGQSIRIVTTNDGIVLVNDAPRGSTGTEDGMVSRVGDATQGHVHTVTFALTSPSGPVTGTITIEEAIDHMGEGAPNFKA
jgi:phage baseplate assembly protein gpV